MTESQSEKKHEKEVQYKRLKRAQGVKTLRMNKSVRDVWTTASTRGKQEQDFQGGTMKAIEGNQAQTWKKKQGYE